MAVVPEIKYLVKEVRDVRFGDVKASGANWRLHDLHQRAALRAIVADVGFAGVPLAYEVDGDLYWVDGHMRSEEYPDLVGAVAVLSVTAEQARLLMATYDPLGALAMADHDKLDAITASITAAGDAVLAFLEDLREAEGVAGSLLAPQPTLADFAPNPLADRADDMAAGGESTSGGLSGASPVPLKLIQFYLEPERYELFITKVRALALAYGTTNITDTVVENVLRTEVS